MPIKNAEKNKTLIQRNVKKIFEPDRSVFSPAVKNIKETTENLGFWKTSDEGNP